MPTATVRTQYRVLCFRCLKVQGAPLPLRLQGTCKPRGRVAEAPSVIACAKTPPPRVSIPKLFIFQYACKPEEERGSPSTP